MLGLEENDDRAQEIFRRLNNRTCVPAKTSSKIFGLGLSKSGTLSLAEALQQLGWDILHSIHFPSSFYDQRASSFVESLRQAFRDHDGACDLEVPYVTEELLGAFPDAYFILNYRSLDDWLGSAEHWFKRQLSPDLLAMREELTMGRLTTYGSDSFRSFPFEKAFIRHHLKVLETIPCCQLLWFDVWRGDGLEKLAQFFGIPEIAVRDLVYPTALHPQDRAKFKLAAEGK